MNGGNADTGVVNGEGTQGGHAPSPVDRKEEKQSTGLS